MVLPRPSRYLLLLEKQGEKTSSAPLVQHSNKLPLYREPVDMKAKGMLSNLQKQPDVLMSLNKLSVRVQASRQ